MKTWLSKTRFVALLGAVISLPPLFAADADRPPGQPASEPVSTAAPVVAEAATPSTVAAPTLAAPVVVSTTTAETTAKLPYGVDDVLKLSRARVNDDVTLNYIQNSGTIYNLGAQDLIYLKNQGVSDKVLNAMQDQRKRAMEALTQTTTSASPAVQVYSGTPTASTAPVYAPQPIYVQEPTYFEPVSVVEPAYEPASSLYVIPYPTPTYPRYTVASSYPSYGYYGGYGSYAVFGGRPPFRPGGLSPALRGGGVRGAYHFGGGHSGGGGSHGHSGHHR